MARTRVSFLESLISPTEGCAFCKLIKMKNRILQCEKHDCFLLKNEEEGFKAANCLKEQNGEIVCDIECDGADRDSVISKKPTDFRYCNRFFTYNTIKTADGKWKMWRKGTCADSIITLSVHCAFPANEQK